MPGGCCEQGLTSLVSISSLFNTFPWRLFVSLFEVQCAILTHLLTILLNLICWWFICVHAYVCLCKCTCAYAKEPKKGIRYHSLGTTHFISASPSLRFQAKATSSGLFHMGSNSWALTCTPSTLLTVLSPKSQIIIVSVLPSFSIPILKTLYYDHLDLSPIINTFGLFFFSLKMVDWWGSLGKGAYCQS